MLLLATFFPDTESIAATGDFNVIAVRAHKCVSLIIHNGFTFSLLFFFKEFLRCSVDIADLLGIAFVLSRIPGKGHSKLISAGLGWAAAEVILSRGLTLWIGARGAEFSWIYIQKCLESNISLVSKHREYNYVPCN